MGLELRKHDRGFEGWTAVAEEFRLLNPEVKGIFGRCMQQIVQPRLADKLPVRSETGDRRVPKYRENLRHQVDSLIGIGIAPLVEQQVHDREGDALIHNPQSQDIEDTTTNCHSVRSELRIQGSGIPINRTTR